MKNIILTITAIMGLCFSFVAYAEEIEKTAKAEEKIREEESSVFEKELKLYPIPKKTEIKVYKKEFSPVEIEILQSLESKRIEIERKNQLLMIREKLLDISEKKLLDKIKVLKNLESNIKKLIVKVDSKEEKRLSDLAVVYSAMKPALAAERLNVLGDSTVYEVLKRMGYKKSAKILEKMKLAKVKIISKMLAEKTQLPKFKQ
ncbi:MAG: hypothetical protein GY793_00920 [Proteobacteria bacterium]|nr:hypothetical protein [Pseudomonadota bacterium]